MILFLLLGYLVAEPGACIVDQCDGNICLIETPEGNVEVPRRPHWVEGARIKCPPTSIDPT
jgi:hypothetical protein